MFLQNFAEDIKSVYALTYLKIYYCNVKDVYHIKMNHLLYYITNSGELITLITAPLKSSKILKSEVLIKMTG